MSKDEQKKIELINQYMEGINKLTIQSYLDIGKVSGSLFTAVKSMMEDYADFKLDQLEEN